MKQLVVISGKGGTGKTSLVASLARVAAEHVPLVMVDCDVDAANLALLFPGDDTLAEPFLAGRRAVIDELACSGCGECVESCRFSAIALGPDDVAAPDLLKCEGCGVCAQVCPEDAVDFIENRAGTWFRRPTDAGELVHARLGIAQDNSGKLVAHVRQVARDVAAERGAELILIDGPPGIGCPVHAALTGGDLALIVTEPTPSGEHDLVRTLELTTHFEMSAAVLVNKADLSPEVTERIRALTERAGAAWLGTLPFDPEIPHALARGELPLAVPSIKERIVEVWRETEAL